MRRGLTLFSALVLAGTLGCTHLIVYDDDTALEKTGKVTARVLLFVPTFMQSEFLIMVAKDRLEEEAKQREAQRQKFQREVEERERQAQREAFLRRLTPEQRAAFLLREEELFQARVRALVQSGDESLAYWNAYGPMMPPGPMGPWVPPVPMRPPPSSTPPWGAPATTCMQVTPTMVNCR